MYACVSFNIVKALNKAKFERYQNKSKTQCNQCIVRGQSERKKITKGSKQYQTEDQPLKSGFELRKRFFKNKIDKSLVIAWHGTKIRYALPKPVPIRNL